MNSKKYVLLHLKGNKAYYALPELMAKFEFLSSFKK